MQSEEIITELEEREEIPVPVEEDTETELEKLRAEVQRLTEELARRKGLAVYEKLKSERDMRGVAVISADTVVCLYREIIGKPRDRADAERMIRALSGRAHTVVSGVAVTVDGKTKSASSVTAVRVASIPEEEIEKYIDSGEPMDKAGAYGIQGKFSLWVEGIDGCYFSVVGLPVNTLAQLYFEVTGERLA